MPPPDLATANPELLAALRLALAEAVAQPELLDLAATMALCAQSKSSIYRGMSDGSFPHSVDTPSGKRWRRRDLLKWIEKLKT